MDVSKAHGAGTADFAPRIRQYAGRIRYSVVCSRAVQGDTTWQGNGLVGTRIGGWALVHCERDIISACECTVVSRKLKGVHTAYRKSSTGGERNWAAESNCAWSGYFVPFIGQCSRWLR